MSETKATYDLKYQWDEMPSFEDMVVAILEKRFGLLPRYCQDGEHKWFDMESILKNTVCRVCGKEKI